MPDFESAANTLRSTFATNLAGLSPTYEAFYDNHQGTPPDDEIWLQFNVLDGAGSHVGFGSGNRYRFPGVVKVKISDEAGQGDGNIRALADTIAGWFRGQLLSGVRFIEPPYLGEPLVDGKWYSRTLNLPFYYDLVD